MSRLFPFRSPVDLDDQRSPRLVDVDDEVADEVFAALSSDTARAILAALHEEPATTSDLADAVDTSVQNAAYHLENLRDAGLVEAVDTWYSERGTEMTVYAPTDESLVVFAGGDKEGTFRTLLARLVGAVTLVGVAWAALDRGLEYLTDRPPFGDGPSPGGADGGPAPGPADPGTTTRASAGTAGEEVRLTPTPDRTGATADSPDATAGAGTGAPTANEPSGGARPTPDPTAAPTDAVDHAPATSGGNATASPATTTTVDPTATAEVPTATAGGGGSGGPDLAAAGDLLGGVSAEFLVIAAGALALAVLSVRLRRG
ncbi:MAG: ArsR/SmtB family transcription factor [Halobacteriaceae archaeon]